jgi:GTP cyclohydrolase IA
MDEAEAAASARTGWARPGTPPPAPHALNGRPAPGACDGGPPRDAAEPGDAFPALVRRMLSLLGEDPEREGLVRTPERVARSLAWLTRGYGMSVREAMGSAVFREAHRGMVLVRDIEMYSLCEHHLLPFFGRVHVAYVPDGRIVGLSKLPRVVEVFARRLQVQERLTEQVAAALDEVLRPRGVAVIVEASHLCMMMRGVEKQNSRTVTSAMRGVFRDDAATREELLRMLELR